MHPTSQVRNNITQKGDFLQKRTRRLLCYSSRRKIVLARSSPQPMNATPSLSPVESAPLTREKQILDYSYFMGLAEALRQLDYWRLALHSRSLRSSFARDRRLRLLRHQCYLCDQDIRIQARRRRRQLRLQVGGLSRHRDRFCYSCYTMLRNSE